MTGIGNVYGEALYQLAKDEHLTHEILKQLQVLDESFRSEPDFIRLLASPALPKAERCQILDKSFRNQVHPYLLNFLKILTEKGYAKHFSSCLDAYIRQYNTDNDILPVKAVTAISLTKEQIARLEGKISAITCKKAQVENRVDEQCLGGVLLEYDGTQVDGSVASRMEKIRKLLKNTVL